MSIESQADRELDLLDDELQNTADPKEREAIRRAMRDIERDLAAHDEWAETGRSEGWL